MRYSPLTPDPQADVKVRRHFSLANQVPPLLLNFADSTQLPHSDWERGFIPFSPKSLAFIPIPFSDTYPTFKKVKNVKISNLNLNKLKLRKKTKY